MKASYLRATAPDGPGAAAPLLRGFWIKLAGVEEQVWVRGKSSDIFVLQEIFENGEYGPVNRWNLPRNATVLDLGGNIGLASIYFSSRLDRSRIIVVEPDHANCISIERSCRSLIKAGRMRLVEAFAAERDGESGIDRQARSWAFKMTDGSQSEERIACVCIPTLLREHLIESVDLLKCDIEGAEAQVFAACAQWIRRVNHLIVETHAPYTTADLYRDLRKANWTFEVLSELQEEKVGLAFLRKLDRPVESN